MTCEACGGDGLIEVGAYRGDEDDTNTRECRLCGGVIAAASSSTVKTVNKLIQDAVRTGVTFGELATDIQRVVSPASSKQDWAKRTADEWNEKLRRENERRQTEAESTAHVDEYYRKAKLGIVP